MVVKFGLWKTIFCLLLAFLRIRHSLTRQAGAISNVVSQCSDSQGPDSKKNLMWCWLQIKWETAYTEADGDIANRVRGKNLQQLGLL